MTIEMMRKEETNSTLMTREKVDQRTEVTAIDHQEFLKNQHPMPTQEIHMLDKTMDTKDHPREKDQEQEVNIIE